MNITICVDAVLKRLKGLVGVHSDAELARTLGLTASNVSSWRRRNTLPYSKCVEIAAQHGATLDWLLFGERDSTSDTASSSPSEPSQTTAARHSLGFADPHHDPHPHHEADVLVDGDHRVSGDLLARSLSELLLMLHDAGTIDLRGAKAEDIAKAYIKALYRNMRKTDRLDRKSSHSA